MKRLVPIAFIAPALLLIIFFNLVPMLQIVYYSLLQYSIFSPSVFSGLANYVRLIHDLNFWWTFVNSLLFVAVTPVLMCFSLTLALIVRKAGKGSTFFRAMYFFPVVTPIVIVGIIWRWLFTEDTGLISFFLSSLGLPQPHWLTEYPTNIITIMVVTIWRGVGYYMMIFLAGLTIIPKDIEEASYLDGATPLQQARHIIVPLLRPVMIFVFVVSASSAIRMFTEIYVMIPGTPIANKALVSFLYQQAFERFDLGYGSAVGVVLFLLTLAFSYGNIKMMESRN